MNKLKISKPMGIAVVSLFTVLVFVIGALFYLLRRTGDVQETGHQLIERQGTDGIPQQRGIIATADNLDEVIEMMERQAEDSQFTASMNIDWVFPRGDLPSSNAFVENSTWNNRTIFFDLYLDETEELLFSSPYIPVGSKLDEVVLSSSLPAGIHPATVVYVLVDDDFEALAMVQVAVILRVLE